MLSVMPTLTRSAGSMSAWVIVTGWVTRDSTEPRFSARAHRSSASINRFPAVTPPTTSNQIMAP